MISAPSPAQAQAARVGDAILRFSDGLKATQADFGSRKGAVFVHGFTADASYMRDLMHQFSGAGFACFAFQYACHRGIDHAARSLVQLLTLLDVNSNISSNRVVLVGHSMGGLVARAAVALFGGAAFARKVITLGTPNDGTLQNRWLPRLMAYWGEAVGGVNPRGFAPQGTSGRQLIKSDPSPPLIDRMKKAAPSGGHVEFFSISGGYGQLDFGKGYWKNVLINNYLQGRLPNPNDGLVGENSSNLSLPAFAAAAPGCVHANSYIAYPHTNHTYLVNNQEVALVALSYAQ